jgi:hypothetical protein
MVLNKFHCPICKVTVNEVPAQHFRYVHHIAPDDIINVLFAALAELDERLTNLTELLEIT